MLYIVNIIMEVGLGMEENKTERDFFTFDEENVEKIPKKKKTKKPFFKRPAGIILIVVLVLIIGGGVTCYALKPNSKGNFRSGKLLCLQRGYEYFCYCK